MMEERQDNPGEGACKRGPKATTKQSISFIPECSSMWRSRWRVQQSINDAKERRMLSLFSSLEIRDPIEIYVDDPKPKSDLVFSIRRKREPEPFNLVPTEFLARARQRPPIDPQPTASGFSSWVYSLYGSAIGDDEDRKHGKQIEQEVLKHRRSVYQCINNAYLRNAVSNWALIHNGIEQSEDFPIEYLTVSHLRVGGLPLRVSPDLMYQNRPLSKLVIVEIKHTKMFVPTNLWPNVWAQLWCYSQIDVARKVDSVSVIGEVWCDEWTRGYRVKGGYQAGERRISLRASVKRNPRLLGYDRFFRELFEIYSGCPVSDIGV